MTDKEKLDAIRAEIRRLVDVRGYSKGMANDLFTFMDSLPNEPVNKDFELALAEMIDKAQKCVVEPWVVAAQWKDELIKLAKSEEPVSEELEEAAFDYAEACKYNGGEKLLCVEHFKAGAKWQKEQMMKDAVDAECDVILLEEGDELQYSVLYPKGKKPFNKGDLAKLIIVKED